jgi:hypothetical protein
MRNGLQKYLLVLLVIALSGISAFGQGASTGSLSGTVLDPKGAVVPGASVKVVNNSTSQEFTVQTTGDGTFTIPALTTGVYTATITAAGFKQSVVTEIKVDVGKPSSINVELEIGSASESVTIVGGGELLQTQTATIGTTLTGRQITDLPTASRDALDLVLTMPGTATPGRPRTSSVNGLPKGALNITIDGLNVQDNLLKSNDGFFTYIRPRTDAISEVTVSTSNPGSESAAEGAVQIKFVTQGGSNEYHGGLYWYHRNPALNANYWFNNRDLPPDPVTHKAPQSRILLNQPGGKVGGPIWIPGLFKGTDRAFFFVNYEEFRLPERTPLRTRTILTETARNGLFRYEAAIPSGGVPSVCTTTGATSGLMRCTVNLYTLAAGGSFPSTPDPTIGSLLSQIRGAVNGLTIRPITVAAGTAAELNREQVSFTNIGGQVRKFPTVRLDFNLTNKHHLENIWNYQKFDGVVDFLNNVDPAFPGFPNHGAQTSIRWSNVTALRSTLTNNIVNEARMGWVGGITHFFSDVNPSQFVNQGGYNLGINAAGITNATVTAAPSRRNSPVKQFQDTLTWNKDNHTFSFGGEVTRVNLFSQSFTRVVPAVAFGIDQQNDSAIFNALFTQGNFPGSSAGIRNTAAALYATLTGRTTQWSFTGISDEQGNYKINGDLIRRMHQTTYGFYVQDSWRLRPNLTLTMGLRNEALLPYVPENKSYSFATYDALFGVSGTDNLFKPGTLSGSPTRYNELSTSGQNVFNPDRWNLLPSIGFSYTPNWKSGVLGWLNGSSGQTVIRGGFSRASVREGTNVFQAVTGSNPGPTFTATRSVALSGANNLPAGTLLRNGAVPAASNVPSSVVYPFVPALTDSVNAFIPDLKLGYVDSYTFGIQRELTKDTVVEVRYVGNRGKDLWRQYDLNEPNSIENGYFAEFKLAQQNLIANMNAGRGINFRYFGPNTGTVPLPIHLINFQGATVPASACGPGATTACVIDPNNPAHYLASNSNWANATLTAALNPLAPNIFGILSNLAFSTTTFRNNRAAVFSSTATSAALKALATPNFFVVNPDVLGDPFVVDNSTRTWYDALQFEWRRRLSKGLLVQGSYTFSKSATNYYASSSSVFKNYFSLHDRSLDKGTNPYDITHAFKTNFIYELPVGRGRQFFSGSNGLVNGLIGGWGFNGFIRWQSGNPINFGNVTLVGMDRKELQSLVKVRKEATTVFFLPDAVISNTAKAFSVNFVTDAVTGKSQAVYTNGAPSGKFIAPSGFGNCLQQYIGQCGNSNLVIKGPSFFRADISLVKKVQFSERMNLELRGEFLNAFNNINFLVGNPGNDLNGAPLTGIIANAYQDSSTTNDPGGRLVQLVVRFNF